MARKTEIRYVNFYTAGSAACKYEPQPIRQKKEVKLPKPRRQKKIVVHVDPVAILGICMAMVLLVSMIVGMVQLTAAQKQANQMQRYVDTLSQRNGELRTTYEQGYDPDEIYEIATAMGMIPAEQAQQLHIHVEEAEPVQEATVWDNIWTFLVGLFA